MSGKEIYYEAEDSGEMLDKKTGQEGKEEIKKRIQKRKSVLEGMLGFCIGILTGLLPGETVAFLFLVGLLLLIFLPLILLLD